MDKISEDLVQRMAACIQAYATGDDALRGAIIKARGRSIHAEFVAIASELPKPIDPDLLEAQRIANDYDWASTSSVVRALQAAIKRGRELAGGAA